MGGMRGAVAAGMRHVPINGKAAARALPIKRNNRKRVAHLPSVLPQSRNRRPLLPPSQALAFASCCRVFVVLPPSPLAAAMAPKTSKSKGVAKDAKAMEPPESALVVQRTQNAYFPSTVNVFELREAFKPLWGVKMGGETMGHPATCVIPASAEAAPNRYPFFVAYFSCGLCPPSLISSMMSCTHTVSTFWILLQMSWRAWLFSRTSARASPACIPTRRSSATTSPLGSN